MSEIEKKWRDATKLRYIFKILKANNITELEVAYDGNSDDGRMNFSSAIGDFNKVQEIMRYNEVSPNTFLDEPTPFSATSIESNVTYSRGFAETSRTLPKSCQSPDGQAATLADVIWESVYSIFRFKNIVWCAGRGNKGCLKFNSLENKVKIKYLKYVESHDEIIF